MCSSHRWFATLAHDDHVSDAPWSARDDMRSGDACAYTIDTATMIDRLGLVRKTG